MPQTDRPLLVDKLCSGDRPSIYVAGMTVAHCLRTMGAALLSVDALGRVVIIKPPTNIQIPRIDDQDLNKLTEDDAISVMVKEGREESEIIDYLRRRVESPDVKV